MVLWLLNKSRTSSEARWFGESVESGREFCDGLNLDGDLRCDRVSESRLDNEFRVNARLVVTTVPPKDYPWFILLVCT